MKQFSLMLLVMLALQATAAAQTVNWPQFRGAQSDGLGEDTSLPDTWSTTENVVWKTDIPGWGWSSPIVWGDRIFLTTAISESEREKLKVGGYPGGGRFYASPWAYNGSVFLLNEDGTTWVVEDGPQFKVIRKNSLNDYARATPAMARGSLFIRTYSALYRLQNTKSAKQGEQR